jgi:hypothetical protein
MPAHYTRALERTLQTLAESARDPLLSTPVEVGLPKLQRLVGRFGAVLRAWQGLDEAADALKLTIAAR